MPHPASSYNQDGARGLGSMDLHVVPLPAALALSTAAANGLTLLVHTLRLHTYHKHDVP